MTEQTVLDSELFERWQNAPRLTSFAGFFERTASGEAGAPDLAQPQIDLSLLDFDLESTIFADTHRRLWGPFDFHYFASIPYRLEEDCRLGAAILGFTLRNWERTARPASVYTLGSSTGCLARTLATLGGGRIETLSCSPTAANRDAFYANPGSEHAHFFHGPFFYLDSKKFDTDPNLHRFRNGFDILYEDTTFQMYDCDRLSQLQFIYPRIKPGGLLIQAQKFAHKDADQYQERERQKDQQFKSKYFSPVMISDKKDQVLATMDNLQVGEEATKDALKSFFRYSVATWNSGNFYTIVSSNSRTAILEFLALLLRPAIPPAFTYDSLPAVWVDSDAEPIAPSLSWRKPTSVTRG